MDVYKDKFRHRGVPIGQVLLTAEDILGDRHRYVNLENTFRNLFAYGAVPLINENDSVAVAELRRQLGENDMLAAYVTNLIRADMLVIFSDVEGLYDAFGPRGPEGKLVNQVTQDSLDLEGMIGRSLRRARQRRHGDQTAGCSALDGLRRNGGHRAREQTPIAPHPRRPRAGDALSAERPQAQQPASLDRLCQPVLRQRSN